MAEEKNIRDSALEFERALNDGPRYDLRLYIAGTSAYSLRAVEAMNRLCKGVLKGRCDLQIIDIYESPGSASRAEIIAIPTLIRMAPLPVRKLVGDLSDRNRVLRFLDLPLEEPVDSRKEEMF